MAKKKQKVYSVGPDELGSLPDNVDVAVYWYECGGYEGSGIVVFYDASAKKWGWDGLSHCSCYGPIDDGLVGDMTWSEVLELTRVDESGIKRVPDDYDFQKWSDIGKKLRQLRKKGAI